MKKTISIVLALVMALATFAPFANAQSEPRDLKTELREAIAEFEAIENPTGLQSKIIDKAKEVESKLDAEISDRFNTDTIYDLDSIPARVMLLGRLGRAIRFATTELKDKVDAAHNKIAEYIFVGLVQIANPFASVSDLEAYAEKFNALQAELLGYPDLGPNDVANLYRRAALDELLHKARFMRFNEFKNLSSESLKELDQVVLEATGVRLKPQSTCKDLDDAAARVNAVIEKLRAEGTERASKSEISQLRSLVWTLRGKLMGHKVPEAQVDRARAISNEVAALMLQTRPEKSKVLSYISEIQAILTTVSE